MFCVYTHHMCSYICQRKIHRHYFFPDTMASIDRTQVVKHGGEYISPLSYLDAHPPFYPLSCLLIVCIHREDLFFKTRSYCVVQAGLSLTLLSAG